MPFIYSFVVPTGDCRIDGIEALMWLQSRDMCREKLTIFQEFLIFKKIHQGKYHKTAFKSCD